MAAIDSLMLDPGADVYYTDGLRNVFEDHMTYLRTLATTTALEVTPMQAHKYEMDLTGLLNELKIPLNIQWVVARMNNFNSINQVPEDLTQVIVPDPKEISKLMQSYSTTQRLGSS